MKLVELPKFSILKKDGLNDISSELLLENGKLKLFPSQKYRQLKWEDFRFFCHQYARYGIPTTELVDFIKEKIDGRSAIEIGSGAGDLGFHLGIPMTDSKIQENPDLIKIYKAAMQPVIKYPSDVEKIDSLDAVIKYKPKVVVASWITSYSPVETTFGSNPNAIKEDKILELIETFIIVGNLDIHWDKPILRNPHIEIYAPWIISRAKNPEKNRIFIIERK